ncbi:MAG: type II toxin-antitoxin system VapC family toxin [Actinomycetales bacterium]
MIVTDASATISALLNDGPARRLLADEQLHAPHLLDPEVASGMRRRVLARDITADQGWAALDVLRRLAVTRYPAAALLDRIWELRDNVSAYDATYVALAEALECPLVTADARLGRAPGARCPVTIVPR